MSTRTLDRPVAPRQRDLFRLTKTPRRLVRLAHVTAALCWLGVDVVIGVLAVTGYVSDEPRVVAASYVALDTFAVPVLLLFGLTTLVSGLVLSIGTGRGVVRYWWLVAKLVINIVLSALVLILLQPRLSMAGVEAAVADTTLRLRLGSIPRELLFPAFVSGAALIGATLLSTFQPWGRTRRRA